MLDTLKKFNFLSFSIIVLGIVLFQFVCVENNKIASINDYSSINKSNVNFRNLNKAFILEFEESTNIILEVSEESESDSILIKKSFSFDLDNFWTKNLTVYSKNYLLFPLIELFIPPPNSNLV
jgi:hypothetical protein